MTGDVTAIIPDWISWCITRGGESKYVSVAGNEIHYLEWSGPTDAPGILLLHGFRGHAHWWDFVAPWLAENYRVIAMDLGGMGDSGRRNEYSFKHHVAEITGLIQATGLRPVTVIGHSFGGRCTVQTCYEHPELIDRAIIVDSRMRYPDDPGPPLPGNAQRRLLNRYSSLEAAKARFRFVPQEPLPHPVIFDHIAERSIRQESGKWTWKFDPGIAFAAIVPARTDGQMLADLDLPVDYVCGEHSGVVHSGLAQRIAKSLRHGRGPVVIPAAYHHIPAGRPLELVAALRALLAG